MGVSQKVKITEKPETFSKEPFKPFEKNGLIRFWKKENQAFYKKWVKLASSGRGDSLVFGWAVSEATFWPIVPDFLIGPLTAGDKRKAFQPLLAACLGSALGTFILFNFARLNPSRSLYLVKRLPLNHEYYFKKVENKLEKNWVVALMFQPWSGIPSKVWAVEGAEKALNPYLALPLMAFSRALRMGLTALIARIISSKTQRYIQNFSIPAFLVYLLLFFYSWWQVVKYRPNHKQ